VVRTQRVTLEHAGAPAGRRRGLVDGCRRSAVSFARHHRSVGRPLRSLPADCAVEVSKKELDALGLFASILGHIGDGNFHESIMYNSKDPKERAAVEKCVKDMVDRALEMEGTCTGEHGIGLGKKDSLVKELGLDTINVMKNIKGALDPYWLMNPGKIMDLPA